MNPIEADKLMRDSMNKCMAGGIPPMLMIAMLECLKLDLRDMMVQSVKPSAMVQNAIDKSFDKRSIG